MEIAERLAPFTNYPPNLVALSSTLAIIRDLITGTATFTAAQQAVRTRLATLNPTQFVALTSVLQQVASAVDLIVQQSRLKDGTRKIVNITEVQGMEGDVIVMQDVFVFEQTGVVEGKIQGRLKATGIRPKFVEKFEVMGINLPPGLFGFTY